jgi:flagellar basal body rod protein FlgB
VGADGNSVSLDREAVKIASNNIRYDAVSSMVAGRLESLLWAARDAR